MSYVDGFVIPVAKKNLAAYFKIAKKAGKVWKELGALDYKECLGDDLTPVWTKFTFPKMAKLKPGETVVFSFIVFKSKAERNRINKAVMKDPRLADMMNMKDIPFDVKRMAYGGFKPKVDL